MNAGCDFTAIRKGRTTPTLLCWLQFPLMGKALHLGKAHRIQATAQDTLHEIALTLNLEFPVRYPDVVVIKSEVKNLKSQAITLDQINQASLDLSPGVSSRKLPDDALFWSLQEGGTLGASDFVLPVRARFTQDNYTGPKGQGNGGGMPFVDLWRPEMVWLWHCLNPDPRWPGCR